MLLYILLKLLHISLNFKKLAGLFSFFYKTYIATSLGDQPGLFNTSKK